MCFDCHNAFDGRYKAHGYTQAELDAEALRAQNQWLAWLWNHEIIIVVAA